MRKEVAMRFQLAQPGNDRYVVNVARANERLNAFLRECRGSRWRFRSRNICEANFANGSIGAKFDVKGIPQLVIVGKDGKVAAQHVGYGEESLPKFVDEINRLWKAVTTQ